MNRMLIVCPTYQRPEMCEDMLKSYIKTKATDPRAPKGWSDMILGLSANDPCIPEYEALGKKYKVQVMTFNTNSTTVIFNEIWKLFKNDYYCFHMTNDDVIYKTEGWDFVFIDVLLQQGGGIVYGDDGFHGAGLCTLPCISNNVLEKTGWLQYSGLDKLFGDAVWMKIGNQVPCIYWHHEMKMEHKHWINGKREQDVTSVEYLTNYKREEMIYNIWAKNLAQADIEKVRTLFTKEQLDNR
jgi:hypothetical protein